MREPLFPKGRRQSFAAPRTKLDDQMALGAIVHDESILAELWNVVDQSIRALEPTGVLFAGPKLLRQKIVAATVPLCGSRHAA